MASTDTAHSVGIVMRTKSRPLLLRRALKSVQAQTYRDWRLVIVNDGGEARDVDDALVEIFSDDARVSAIHHPHSMGMEAASNAGLTQLETDFAVIHDDDDSWDPRFLSTALTELNREKDQFPSLAGIALGVKAVFETLAEDRVIFDSEHVWHADPKRPLVAGFLDLHSMLARNQFPPIAFVYDLPAARRLGFYRTELPVLGDWEFHARFAIAHDIWVHPDPLANYHHRLSETGVQGNSIFVGADKHRVYAQMLKNEWCRHELGPDARARASMGALRAFEHATEDRLHDLEAHELRHGKTLEKMDATLRDLHAKVDRGNQRRRYFLFGPRES